MTMLRSEQGVSFPLSGNQLIEYLQGGPLYAQRIQINRFAALSSSLISWPTLFTMADIFGIEGAHDICNGGEHII